MVLLLTENLSDGSISPEFLASLEREVSTSADTGMPRAKRQKLDAGSSLSLKERVSICSALKNVVQGRPPPPQLWRRLGSTEATQHFEFILQVSVKGNNLLVLPTTI